MMMGWCVWVEEGWGCIWWWGPRKNIEVGVRCREKLFCKKKKKKKGGGGGKPMFINYSLFIGSGPNQVTLYTVEQSKPLHATI